MEYRVFLAYNAYDAQTFLDDCTQEGFKLISATAGTVPHTNYNGDIDGNDTALWLIVGKESN